LAVGCLFQGRFFSCPIHTGDYLFTAIRYVERNPVRAGIARYPWDYTWSSAAFHCDLIENGNLVVDSPLLEEIVDWKGFLSETPKELPLSIQETTGTGRPFGPDSFYSIVEKVTGHDARRRKAGRPKKN
jgi:putative transposase